MTPSSKARIYSGAKISTIVDLLADEGISAEKALADIALSLEQLESPATKVSATQVLQSYRNAIKLSQNPQFASLAGSKSSVSTYGIYGFAILSSPNFRDTMNFATAYHRLAAPLMDIEFREEGRTAVWIVTPARHLEIDEPLCRFIIDFQMAVHLSLHRNIMGPEFKPLLVQYALEPLQSDGSGADFFDCPALYSQTENRFTFDAAWLDRRPDLANKLAHAELKQLCNSLLKELELSEGIAGEVRDLILSNLSQPISFEQVAKHLNMSGRSLRRRLQEEGTYFRQLVDRLRGQVAMKYVHDTDLSVEDIAFALGFSDASSFRHAFRRWTNTAPLEYRKGIAGARRETSINSDA